MPAFFIANVTKVTDPDKLKEYGQKVGPVTEKYRGKLIAANPAEIIEGEGESERFVILQFPDMATLKAWHSSEEYKPIGELRLAATEGTAFAVDGLS